MYIQEKSPFNQLISLTLYSALELTWSNKHIVHLLFIFGKMKK